MAARRRIAGLFFLLPVFLAALHAPASPPEPAPPAPALGAFQKQVATAFRAHDPAALQSLICWDRVDQKIRRSQEGYFQRIVAESLKTMNFRPWNDADPSEQMDMNGVIYRYNVPPVGTLDLTLSGGWAASWPVAERGDSCFLAIMFPADTLVDVEEDTVWKNPALTPEERRRLDDYYRGDLDVDRLITPAIDDAEDPRLPTLQHRGVRLLMLYLEDALDAEVSGRAKWQPTPYLNGPSEVNRAQDLRERIATRLDRSLPACALPLAKFYLHRESSPYFQLDGMKLLSRIEGTRADSLILDSIDHPTGNDRISLEAVLAASRRGLRPSASSLRRLAGGHRPSLADSVRALNDRLGYPPLPPFSSVRAYRSPQVRALLEAVDSLWLDPAPGSHPFVEVRFIPGCGDSGTIQPFYGWLEEEALNSVRILSPSGVRYTFARVDTSRTLDYRVSRCDSIDMHTFTLPELAARYRGSFSTSFFEHSDADLERTAVVRWFDREGRGDLAAEIMIPLLDRFMSDEQYLDRMRAILGIRQGYRMFVAFVGDRDYPQALAEARLLLKRYPDTMFSKYAEQFLVELPRRMDDYAAFRLPTPGEWKTLRANLSREEQIDYLCSRLRLVNGFQWSQPGGVMFYLPQTAEPQGLSQDAAWCLGRGRTPVINPLAELSPADSWGRSDDSLGVELTIADIPRLAAHLDEDWFVPGVEFWRDFRSPRHLYRTPQLLAGLIRGVALRPLLDADDWAFLSAEEKSARVDSLTRWAASHADSEEALVMAAFEKSDSWSDARPLLHRVSRFHRPETIPLLLSKLEVKDFRIWGGAEIYRTCRASDPRALLGWDASGQESDVRVQAGLVQIGYGDRSAGLAAVAAELADTSAFWVTPATAREAVACLLESKHEEYASIADGALGSRWFRRESPDDQASILAALMAGSRTAPYRWLQEALRDSAISGSFVGDRTVYLPKCEWTASMMVQHLLPADSRISFDPDWPRARREDAVAKATAWVEKQLASLPPSPH